MRILVIEVCGLEHDAMNRLTKRGIDNIGSDIALEYRGRRLERRLRRYSM